VNSASFAGTCPRTAHQFDALFTARIQNRKTLFPLRLATVTYVRGRASRKLNRLYRV
jgi:hypothetical protein